MTFATYEMSREDGRPASLFLIVWGNSASAYDAYTDSDVPITYGGKTYNPTVIGREKIESSGSLDKKALQIDVSPNASIVTRFQTPPSQKVALTIRQGHVGDSEWPVCWTGIIKNIVREGGLARIIAEPLDTLLARPGLRRHYMIGCPHVLYDTRTCRANKNTLKVTRTPTAVGGNYVTLASTWNTGGAAKPKYIGGYVQWTDASGNTQTRGIIRFGANQNQLVLGNTADLTVSSSLSIFAGCNHQLNDCRDLHANVENYGGQPFIPDENPVGFKKNHYY